MQSIEPDSQPSQESIQPLERPEDTALRRPNVKEKTSSFHEHKQNGFRSRQTSFTTDINGNRQGQANATSISPLRRLSIINKPPPPERRPSILNQSLNSSQAGGFGERRASMNYQRGSIRAQNGGFDNILNKVTSTFKMENVLPKSAIAGSSRSIHRENSERLRDSAASIPKKHLIKQESSTSKQLIRQESSTGISAEPAIPTTLRRLSISAKQDLPPSSTRSSSEVPDKQQNPFGILGTIIVDDENEDPEGAVSTKEEVKTREVREKPTARIEKRESSKMFQRYATWNKGAVTSTKDDDKDTESLASNESYDDKKEVQLNTPLASFAGELIKNKPAQKESAEQLGNISISVAEPDKLVVPTLGIPKEGQKLLIPTAPGTTTSLLVPGSDMVHVRRASFSANLFKTPPPSVSSEKSTTHKPSLQPSSTFYSYSTSSAQPAINLLQSEKSEKPRRRSVVTFGENEVKLLADSAGNSITEEGASTNDITEGKSDKTTKRESKRESLQVPSSLSPASVDQTVSVWKKLKKESKANLADPSSTNGGKFTNMIELLTVIKDMRTLGMDTKMVNEVDKGTLLTVVGVKKWAQNTKVKRANANIPLRKFAKTIEQRMSNELPHTLYLDLISEVIPLLKKCEREYRKQLGDKHQFTRGCSSYISGLMLKGRSHALGLPAMVDASKHSLHHSTMIESMSESGICCPSFTFSPKNKDRGRVGILKEQKDSLVLDMNDPEEEQDQVLPMSRNTKGHVSIDIPDNPPPTNYRNKPLLPAIKDSRGKQKDIMSQIERGEK